MIVRSVMPIVETGDRIMTLVTIVRIEEALGIIAMRALQILSVWLHWLFYYGVDDKWCSRLRFCLLHFLLFSKFVNYLIGGSSEYLCSAGERFIIIQLSFLCVCVGSKVCRLVVTRPLIIWGF
jgi:hypothetical protein